jgi:hypothetical protein
VRVRRRGGSDRAQNSGGTPPRDFRYQPSLVGGDRRIGKRRDHKTSKLRRQQTRRFSLSFYHHIAMDLSVPWTPSLNGNNLRPFDPIAELIEEESKPSPRRDPHWTKESLDTIVAACPEAEEVIWDCVLSLWRLKKKEPDGEGDEDISEWADNVSAWLVSRRISRLRG